MKETARHNILDFAPALILNTCNLIYKNITTHQTHRHTHKAQTVCENQKNNNKYLFSTAYPLNKNTDFYVQQINKPNSITLKR